jgi:hypothetical protein
VFFQWLWLWSEFKLCVDSAAEESSDNPVVYVYRASHYFPAKKCRVLVDKSKTIGRISDNNALNHADRVGGV